MAPQRHYLDHASTTPIRPESLRAMSEWLGVAGTADGVGDPGRVHEEGRRARIAVESAREVVAGFLGTEPSRLIFTSGATEAANAAVFGLASLKPGAGVACAPVEHSCVRLASERAGKLVELPVDGYGQLEIGALSELLEAETLSLVNCQLANHEVGTLQPLAEVVELCHGAGVPVHCDAAAAAGHVSLAFAEMGVDLLSVSAHKLGGPPGIGALVARRGLRLASLLVGGSEERGRRAGGENVPGIVGFAAACAALGERKREEEAAVAREHSRRLAEAAMRVPGVGVLGHPERRLPHLVCLEVEGVLGEAVLLSLDRAGVAAHSGSACSSEVLEPSPVLAAMGADPDRSLRVSVGWSTTAGDVAAFAAAFPEAVDRLRALGSG